MMPSWRSFRWIFVLLFWTFFAGCFRIYLPRFPHHLVIQLTPDDVALKLSFYAKDQEVLPDIIAATKEAFHVNRRWGKLEKDLHIRIFPSHRTLEEAVMKPYEWLRAWAMYDQIYLQSPLTWRARYYRYPLLELLIHEITHVTMYQLCGTSTSWNQKQIPLWFREGMASVTAHQQYRRTQWKQLRQLIRKTRWGQKFLAHPAHYLKEHQPLIYSLGHWMFLVLLERWKDEGIRLMLSQMKDGASYKEAFTQMTRMTPKEFKNYFYKRLQGPPPKDKKNSPSPFPPHLSLTKN